MCKFLLFFFKIINKGFFYIFFLQKNSYLSILSNQVVQEPNFYVFHFPFHNFFIHYQLLFKFKKKEELDCFLERALEFESQSEFKVDEFIKIINFISKSHNYSIIQINSTLYLFQCIKNVTF